MEAKGKVIKYGNNVDTDVIIPARYLNTSEPAELAKHCMEDLDSDFLKKVSKGDMIVAGSNFGCGSSREHAPIAIKACGISCVIAETFARIFYRNAINIGLPINECPEAAQDISAGDIISIDFEKGRINNLTRNKEYSAVPFPAFMQEIMAADGLIEYIRKESGK
jgi:3-isopropylmalate/(R)-2-methylmalate dehydratase small subunit